MERRIYKREQYLPPLAPRLIGEMFQKHSRGDFVKVHYSVVDNDDTVASYAEKLGGVVLSGDSDYFLYVGATYKVYSDFYINQKGYLVITEAPIPTYSKKPQRELITPQPATRQYYFYVDEILVPPCTFRRGSASALTLEIGSPHILIRPLR